MDDRPIAVFDSGVGGLSILNQIQRTLPAEHVLYFADQAHVPYGPRSLEEVEQFSVAITEFLLSRDAKLVVVACNTASAAALHALRRRFLTVPFVGMEPAVKPAALTTRSGKVGVLATPATFQGRLFASVVERFAEGVEVLERTVPGLVDLIESGDLDGPEVTAALEGVILPLMREGVDTLVLACTHYPFVVPAIEHITRGEVEVIDPSPAIARQTARLLLAHKIERSAEAAGDLIFYSTADPERLLDMARTLTGTEGEPRQAEWRGRTVHG